MNEEPDVVKVRIERVWPIPSTAASLAPGTTAAVSPVTDTPEAFRSSRGADDDLGATIITYLAILLVGGTLLGFVAWVVHQLTGF